MKLLEQRMDDLEYRIRQLEKELASLREQNEASAASFASEEKISSDAFSEDALFAPKSHPKLSERVVCSESEPHAKRSDESLISFEKENEQNEILPPQDSPTRYEKFFQRRKSSERSVVQKDRESIVGKYIIGALAALLVFIGAASFVAIVWHRISDEMKLLIIGGAGLTLSAVGLQRSVKNPSSVASVLLGTGAGLVYIAILAANLAFHLIDHEISTLLCTLWTAFLMFSYKYTKLFFTVLIAYIGSYINLITELQYASSTADYLLVLSFITSVSVVMIYASHAGGKTRYSVSLFLSLLSYGTFLFFRYFDFIFSDEPYQIETVAVLMIFILQNLYYRLSERENFRYSYFVFAIFSTLALNALIYTAFRQDLSQLQCHLLFFAVNFIQFAVNSIKYRTIDKKLSYFYMAVLYLSILSIHSELWNISAGATVLILILSAKEYFTREQTNFALLLAILVADTYLLAIPYESISILYSFVNLGWLLFFSYRHRENQNQLLIKNLAMSFILINSFVSVSSFIYEIGLSPNMALDFGIGHLFTVGMLYFLYKTDFLCILSDAPQSIRGRAILCESDGFSACAVILYMIGLSGMLYEDESVMRFMLTFSTLAVAMFQTRLSLQKKEISFFSGIWNVIKYLLFIWTMLYSFLELPFESALYSVSGLILAVAAIYFGFRLRAQSIRHFGLAVTMLMVAKFIIVDLSGENSMTRVLAFVFGGILCFIISIIYNRLSKAE